MCWTLKDGPVIHHILSSGGISGLVRSEEEDVLVQRQRESSRELTVKVPKMQNLPL